MAVCKRVYLVRHGQSEGNAIAAYQDPLSPLSDDGRAQARSVGERISKIPHDSIIASTLPRAQETASIIAKGGDNVFVSSDLFIELKKPSSINGKLHSDEAASSLNSAWLEALFTSGLRAEDGENYDDALARADQALNFLAERPESTIIVVSHDFFLRVLIARAALGDSLTEGALRSWYTRIIKMQNTAISAIQYDGQKWGLWIFNDHAHLG